MITPAAYRRASSGDSPLQTPHRSSLPDRQPATASQYAHRQRDEANHARSSAVSGMTNRIKTSLSPERVSESTATQRRLPQAVVDPENRFHARTRDLQWLSLLWDARACWICDERGPCRHREPDVDLAELATRVFQPMAEKARVA